MRARTAACGTAVVLSLLAGGCAAPEPQSVPTARVEPGVFEIRIRGVGSLEAEQATPISAPPQLHSRQRIAWLIEDGSRVEGGEALARIDASELERQADRARDAIERLDLQLTARRRKLAKQRRQFEEKLELLEREKRDAERFAPRDDELFSRHDILDAQADLALLDKKIEHAESTLARYEERAEAEMEILRLQRQTEQVKLTQLENQLESLVVKAPHAGFFFRRSDWQGEKLQVGDVVWPGHPIGELPDVSQMKAKIHVLESEAAGLEQGLPVRIALEAYPSRTYGGEIVSVQPIANTLHRQSPVKYFTLEVALDRTETAVMKPAAEVRATIYVMKREGVVSVPNQAIFQDGERAVVYVFEEGAFVEKPVSLGQRSLSRTIVVDGLEQGERIALVEPEKG
jgi:multidrug efflux pump subunit AcrA (membrane-fusion protein)